MRKTHGKGVGRALVLVAVLGSLAAVMMLPSSAMGVGRITARAAGKPDLDTRTGIVRPSAAQTAAVERLGAHATWNRFGTPASLIRYGGYLATPLGDDPVDAAKAFVKANRGLFRLSGVDSLVLVNDSSLTGTDAHAVLFAQRFGGLVSAQDGMITVGVTHGKVAYVSSTAAGGSRLTGSPKLSATEAWSIAARSVGVRAGAISNVTKNDGWTQFDAGGLIGGRKTKSFTLRSAQGSPVPPLPTLPPAPPLPTTPDLPGTPDEPQTPSAPGGGDDTTPLSVDELVRMLLSKLPLTLGGTAPAPAPGASPVNGASLEVPQIHQQARLVAFPTVKNGVRPAWEADVIDLHEAGNPVAYQFMVDAETGKILFRRNAVQQVAEQSTPQPYVFTGETGATSCGPKHTFAVSAGQRSIVAVGSYVLPTNDAVLKLYDPSGANVASQDTGTSPEPIYYEEENAGDLPTGDWAVQLCPFGPSSIAPQTPPYLYAIVVAVTSLQVPILPTTPRPLPPTAVTNNPRWQFFGSYPRVDYSSEDTRVEGCWKNTDDGIDNQPCDMVLENPHSPFGWDVHPRTNQSTLTTRGNNAMTAQAWASPLTPADNYTPVSVDRRYNFPWANQWYTSKCDPAVFASAKRNDIDAAITNLFAMHNRMHDFAYALGFTERNYNLQLDNRDKGVRPVGPYPFGREADPELGDAQAGAADGGQPTFEGRDNANQITLNDGVPPITNQYLWQPIAGAFYSPCVDGAYDLSVAGHEYTHAISNRMVGGPDAGLTGQQAGSMGESWSDLDALEVLHEYGLAGARGENPWSLGSYVTGNEQRGIRDYALDENPLNFGDVGFDITGPEVHADGEIWNAVNYEVRRELVKKYGAGSAAVNLACAKGERPVDRCPGGRRWIQIVYDAWLLMQPSVSMVDARDAYLAADVMRFGGVNQKELWRGFARTGLGSGASTEGTDDTQPTPSFESPAEANATVTFQTVARNEDGAPVKAKVYVGDYEARVTPIADTDDGSALGDTASFVPGRYRFVVQADGYGLVKFARKLDVGSTTLTVSMPTNWASKRKGATASGDGVNLDKLIDDTEATNWYSDGDGVKGMRVTVTMNGRHVVRAVRVSAMLRPGKCDGVALVFGESVLGSGGPVEDPGDPDPGSQNRFTALRSFAIEACDQTKANCTVADSWRRIYTSPADAFPGVRPRPVVPDLTLRTFDVTDTPATMVRLVVLSSQCTGGPDFAGEQDNDPSNDTDCATASGYDQDVRAAELEVVSSGQSIRSGPAGQGHGKGKEPHKPEKGKKSNG